jgi:hypothetical protein
MTSFRGFCCKAAALRQANRDAETRHPELVSGPISPQAASAFGARWVLKRVQDDGESEKMAPPQILPCKGRGTVREANGGGVSPSRQRGHPSFSTAYCHLPLQGRIWKCRAHLSPPACGRGRSGLPDRGGPVTSTDRSGPPRPSATPPGRGRGEGHPQAIPQRASCCAAASHGLWARREGRAG